VSSNNKTPNFKRLSSVFFCLLIPIPTNTRKIRIYNSFVYSYTNVTKRFQVNVKDFLHKLRDDWQTKVDYCMPCLTNHNQVSTGTLTLQVMAMKVACLLFELSAIYNQMRLTLKSWCLVWQSRDLSSYRQIPHGAQ